MQIRSVLLPLLHCSHEFLYIVFISPMSNFSNNNQLTQIEQHYNPRKTTFKLLNFETTKFGFKLFFFVFPFLSCHVLT